ncbi:S-adenosyl-L-methionine-dependent methyltransferase [Zychaea mexicana]|uniref:S-adenosyl-L-methionine-dependent methyltransferase n=1 Tax=Zychaea mexicana TaxID=64656 RepID=UPI0022FE3809|nr:S-adenosyl-L-methionine-dependent methyltransferase [Zychaea mexicana]KAI9484975.1 S-adenosyl-L-methionine-dependent methyltransferase [Zychaea mexicana]
MSDTEKKQASSALDSNATNSDQAKFGSRLLDDVDAVFQHNAWDHVEWDEEHEKYAQSQIERHHNSPVPHDEQGQYFEQAPEYWNKFYEKNENRFFKDRNWLRIEFPEIFETTRPEAGSKRIFEVGCGAGNTLFPVLQQNENPDLFCYAADFSSTAVQVVRNSELYDTTKANAFVWDLASPEIPDAIEPGSLDIIVLIFVFSALAPEQWDQALLNIHKMLKPGGLVVFRDYGRHDLAQLRFKERRMLRENFYIRGDGTRVYFFTSEEIESMFTTRVPPPGFAVEQNAVDRRLIVNRSKKLKMYRVWLQGKFRKL